jgi:hypothetical protein
MTSPDGILLSLFFANNTIPIISKGKEIKDNIPNDQFITVLIAINNGVSIPNVDKIQNIRLTINHNNHTKIGDNTKKIHFFFIYIMMIKIKDRLTIFTSLLFLWFYQWAFLS